MILSLDASAAVELLRARGHAEMRRRFVTALTVGRQIWLSSIVIQELMVGALKSQEPVKQIQRLDDLIDRLKVAEFTAEDAIVSARIRAELEQSGRAIGALDTLIAGQALGRGWTLVTQDLNHFVRVAGLTLIDWTRSDDPFDPRDWLAQPPKSPKDPK